MSKYKNYRHHLEREGGIERERATERERRRRRNTHTHTKCHTQVMSLLNVILSCLTSDSFKDSEHSYSKKSGKCSAYNKWQKQSHMTASIDKLIHKVNSSTANLTCILTNGIACQFVYINSHEGWMCTMYNVKEYCYSTRWTLSSCPIYFEIVSCTAIFFCFCI